MRANLIVMERGVKYRDADMPIPVKMWSERDALLRKPEWMKINFRRILPKVSRASKCRNAQNGSHLCLRGSVLPKPLNVFNHGTAMFMILMPFAPRRRPFYGDAMPMVALLRRMRKSRRNRANDRRHGAAAVGQISAWSRRSA